MFPFLFNYPQIQFVPPISSCVWAHQLEHGHPIRPPHPSRAQMLSPSSSQLLVASQPFHYILECNSCASNSSCCEFIGAAILHVQKALFFHDLWVLQSFYFLSRIFRDPWEERNAVDVLFMLELSMDTRSLYFNQLWTSVFSNVHCSKTFLLWGVKAVLSNG